eukprot:1157725-Pelagomonas_calceolata.AAC.10
MIPLPPHRVFDAKQGGLERSGGKPTSLVTCSATDAAKSVMVSGHEDGSVRCGYEQMLGRMSHTRIHHTHVPPGSGRSVTCKIYSPCALNNLFPAEDAPWREHPSIKYIVTC